MIVKTRKNALFPRFITVPLNERDRERDGSGLDDAENGASRQM
jgi:hypothetical protein